MKRSRDGGGGGGRGRNQGGRGRGRGGGRGGRGRGRGGSSTNRNPRRGGPGMLLTCEAGREDKCRREGLDLLRHYYYRAASSSSSLGGQGKSGAVVGGNGGADRTDGAAAEPISADRGKDAEATTTVEEKGSSKAEDEARVNEDKELSLEEEIAMLRSGKSADEVLLVGSSKEKDDGDECGSGSGSGSGREGKSEEKKSKKSSCPFSVYETGCRGSVFVLCTLPDCNLVTMEEKAAIACEEKKDGDETAKEKEDGGANGDNADGDDGTSQSDRPEGGPSKRIKVGEEGGAAAVSKPSDRDIDVAPPATLDKQQQRSDDDKNVTTEVAAAVAACSRGTEPPSPPPWDPIDTIRRVTGDITLVSQSSSAAAAAPSVGAAVDQEDGGGGSTPSAQAAPPSAAAAPSSSSVAAAREAPSSRFVTRMIPIQATCFASYDEMERLARPLLRRYLLPAAVELWRERDSGGGSEQQQQQQLSQGGGEGGGGDEAETQPKQSKPEATTFEIAFKRRNCSNVRRDQTIQVVAKIVQEEMTAAAAAEPGMLAVDLTNPDFTIQIEICRTLCGMAVVPNCKASFQNFNLIEMREGKA